MIGVLDLTGNYRVANAHTLGMVVAAVNAIENQLRLQRATNKLYMAYRYSNILLEHMSDGLISVDNSGIVTEINARGGELFGVAPSAVKGRHISEVVNVQGSVVSSAGGRRRSQIRGVADSGNWPARVRIGVFATRRTGHGDWRGRGTSGSKQPAHAGAPSRAQGRPPQLRRHCRGEPCNPRIETLGGPGGQVPLHCSDPWRDRNR